MNRSVLLGCAALLSSAACGETYYWVGGSGDTYGSYADVNNWRLGSAEGTVPERVPGPDDKMYGIGSRSIDLDGQSYEISGWDSTADWTRYNYNFKNGTLTVVGDVTTHSDTVSLFEGATLVYKGTFTPALNDGGAHEIFVHAGGDLQILGRYQNYKTKLTIDDGATCTLAPTWYGLYNPTAQKSTYTNYGQLSFPNGFVWQGGSGSSGAGVVLDQNAGMLILGGPLSKNGQKGSFTINLSGGSAQVTGDASFEADEVKVTAQQFAFNVDEGKSLALGAMTYAADTVITKSGKGRLVFGVNMPSAVNHFGGTIAIEGENATLNGTVDAADGCVIEIGAKGFTCAANVVSPVQFKVASGIFEVGDVILTCENEDVLRDAYDDLAATGMSLEIVGSTLVKAESSARFVSTTITDLANADGWEGGVLPAAGSEVSIDGAGVVAVVSSAIPDFSKITVKNGAELKIDLEGEGDFPCVALVGSSKLTVSGRMNVPRTNYLTTSQGSAGEMPIIEVVANGVLTVPGGMNFKDVDFRLTGAGYDADYATLQTVGNGPLTFGYAAAGESTKIAFTSTFGKILTPGTRGTCNTRFAYAEEGGSITVVGEMLARETEFKRDKSDATFQHGFDIGHGMDPEVPFNITFDACRNVTCLYETTFEGGAVVTVANGTVIGSTFTTSNNGSASQVQIHIRDKAKLILDGESSLQMAITANWSGSYLDLSPSEDGWESLVVKNESFVYLGRQQGNDKARITVENGIWECFYTEWWGADRLQWIFNHAKEVYVPADKTLTVRLVKFRFGSDQGGRAGYYPMSWTPIVGEGDVVVSNGCSDDFRLELESAANACTGTLSVDGTQQKNSLFLEDGVVWPGKVVLDDRVSIGKSLWEDKSKGHEYQTPQKDKIDAPATVTLGEAELASDRTLRLWGMNGLTNDMINVTGAGWSGAGKLLFTVADGYEAQAADKWVLGSAPKDTPLPITSEKWQLAAEADPADETKVRIVLSPAATDYNFISNQDGSTNLGDATAWQGGVVPTGKDVTILGSGVVAEINDDQPLPDFASIAVRDGATLRINADLSEAALPPISVGATARIEVKAGATLVLPSGFVSSVSVEDGAFVSMAKITVEKDATLTIPGGTYLKNLDLTVYGTLKSLGTGQITFGHANAGETTYFAFTADGATINMPGNENGGLGTRNWLRPAAGGRVKAIGAIVFKDTTFPVKYWNDYCYKNLCVDNPLDESVEFVFDNSVLEASYATQIGGAAHLLFKNGGRLTRSAQFAGMDTTVSVVENATVVFEGENSGMSFNTNVGVGLKLKTKTADRTVLTLKDGAYLNVRRVDSGNGAGIAVEGTARLMVDKPNGRAYVLYDGTPITVPEDAVLTIQSVALDATGTDGDRDCQFLGAFAGAGEVRVTNLTPGKAFQLTMTRPSPNFAGTIKVVPVEQENTPTTLCFAPTGTEALDWSQATVVADGNVKLVNADETVVPVEVTFGTLRIERGQSLDIRLWEDGSAITSDKVNLTVGAAGGGLLNIVPQDEAVLNMGERFVLGTAPVGAWKNLTLRSGGKLCGILETPVAGSSLVTCTARLASGLMLILR